MIDLIPMLITPESLIFAFIAGYIGTIVYLLSPKKRDDGKTTSATTGEIIGAIIMIILAILGIVLWIRK